MRALLIYNPAAGRQRYRQQLPAAVTLLEGAGWTVDRAPTQGPGHASQLARQACAQGYDVALVAGGDGTINQAADGLISAGRSGLPVAALGILPMGTANVLARDLGMPVAGPIPGDPLQAAARLLLESRVVQVDAGLADNGEQQRVFVCWAGVGVDAAITAHVEANPQVKRRIGPLSFALSALAQTGHLIRRPRFAVKVDGQAWHGKALLLVASNIQHYAIVLDMAPEARLNDGRLDVALFHSTNLYQTVKQLWLLRRGQHIDRPDVSYAQACRVEIATDRPEHVHLDAEPFDTTPVTLEVLARSLPMLLPPSSAARRLVGTQA